MNLKDLKKATLGTVERQTGTAVVKSYELYEGKAQSGKDFQILNLKADLTFKGTDGEDKTIEWVFNKLEGHYKSTGTDGTEREYENRLNVRLDKNGHIEASSILGRFMDRRNIKDVESLKGMNLPAVRENGVWKIAVKV